jgi:hypothetical protein
MLCIKEKQKGTAAYGFQQDRKSAGIILHKMKIFHINSWRSCTTGWKLSRVWIKQCPGS